MKKELKAWLNAKEKDYNQGLMILSKFSKNRILRDRLTRKAWPEKLEYELRKIAKRLKIDLNKKEAPTPEQKEKTLTEQLDKSPLSGTSRQLGTEQEKLVVIRDNKQVKLEELPEHLRLKWKENADNYHLARGVHAKLKTIDTAVDRVPLLQQLSDLDAKIRKNWSEIDAWKPGAPAPDPTSEKKDDKNELTKRIGRNRKYISTNKQKLIKLEGQEREKLFKKIQDRIDQLKTDKVEMEESTIIELKDLGFKL